MIPYAKQSIVQNDIDAVVNVLTSDFLTQGPVIPQFEKKIAEYCGAQYSIAVTNATSALHLACLALDIGSGDIVWTSPNTFVASANCVLYCGAKIDFVDINCKTYNMSAVELEIKLAEALNKNKLPKAIIAVHFAGQSCEMKKIHALAKQYDIAIIEDASHALGGDYLGTKVGSCRYSDITVFSFHPVKSITSGEGGMLLTNNALLADKINLLANHGITRTTADLVNQEGKPCYYEQQQLGYNYRMSDIHAALGLSQFSRLDSFINKRKLLAETYLQKLKDLPLHLPEQLPTCSSAWHLFVVLIDTSRVDISRDQLIAKMKEKGIATNIHYIPVHSQPYYLNQGFKWGDFPKCEEYYKSCLSLPLYFDLDLEKTNYIVENLNRILQLTLKTDAIKKIN